MLYQRRKLMDTNIQIAIDGSAASGKSTVAKILAKRLNIIYLDTGAMYRAVTYWLLEQEVDLSDSESVNQALETMNMTLDSDYAGTNVFVNGVDVTSLIRSEAVNAAVSSVSAMENVRSKMVALQQKIAEEKSVVMDGRDIGTVVLPQADFKFFITADPAIRAERRYKEEMNKGTLTQSLAEIEEAIKQRDYYDSHRKIGPLKKADDAIEIDSSHLSILSMVDRLLSYIEKEVSG